MKKQYTQLMVIENKKTGVLLGRFTECEAQRIINKNSDFKRKIYYYSTKPNKKQDVLFVNTTIHGTYTVKKNKDEALTCIYGSGCAVQMAEKYYRQF
jgi:hypothetical protein